MKSTQKIWCNLLLICLMSAFSSSFATWKWRWRKWWRWIQTMMMMMMAMAMVGRSSKRVSAVGESERASQFIDMAQLLGDSCFEHRHHHHQHHLLHNLHHYYLHWHDAVRSCMSCVELRIKLAFSCIDWIILILVSECYCFGSERREKWERR